MPITIQHTPVGALGRLAVMAGQVRGQQLKMARDIQWASLAQAGARQVAPTRLAADRRREPFAMQQAGARQIAEQRPVTPEVAEQRVDLQKFVADMKAAGIYDPTQIKHAQLFASIGDEQSVRSIAGRLPRPEREPELTAGQKELGRQSIALGELGERGEAALLSKIETKKAKIQEYISHFTPEQQRELMEHPEYAGTKVQGLLADIQQLRNQIDLSAKQITYKQQGLALGFTLPKQEARRLQQISGKRKAEIATVLRVEGRRQSDTRRELSTLERKLKRNPYADPEKENARITELNVKKEELEKELRESYAREDAVLGGGVVSRQMTPAEENVFMDSLLAETGGDIEAAKRLAVERSGQ